MALRGIDEYWQAFDQWNREIESDLGRLAEQIGLHPNEIIGEAVALKNRRFNLAFNLDTIPDEDRLRVETDELAEAAREYRRQSRGGDS